MSSLLPDANHPGMNLPLGSLEAIAVPRDVPLAARPKDSDSLAAKSVADLMGADSGNHKHKMIHMKLGLVSSLFYSLHAKHVPTASHSLRVALGISTWGIHERLRERELELAEVAALLHDLGKIGVPDSILQKPTRLTSDEQSLVALHPQIGIEILRSAGANDELVHAVQHVGVWYNQFATTSDRIGFESLASQMISIADAFDAMTTDQIYRKALSQEQALKELFKNSGTQFNPKLVRSFANSLAERSENTNQRLNERWLGGFRSTDKQFPTQFAAVSTLNLNAAQQSLTSVFRNQLLDTMQDAVLFVDLDGQILEWNSTAERLTGRTRNSLLQHHWTCELLAIRDTLGNAVQDANCPVREVMTERNQVTRRYEFQHCDGRDMTVEFDVVPVFDKNKSLCGVAAFFRDASEQVNLEQHVASLHDRATRDPLTRVANRAELNRRLPEFVAYHHEQKQPGSLIICDIDFFKRVNDTYGHPAGDEALIMFATLLREFTRDSDLVARYGGEEFVILCPACDAQMAVEKAERIRAELQNRPLSPLRGNCITASFGVSQLAYGDSHETLLNRADQSLLLAKESGRNRVMTSEVQAVEPKEDKAEVASWRKWFGLTPGEVLLEADMVADVPIELSINRLQGFIVEKKVEVVSAEGDRATLKIDGRNLPPSQREGDRIGVFVVDIQLLEARWAKNDQSKMVTFIKIAIRSARNRDRRNANLVHQAEKIRAIFQSYLMTTIPDSVLLKSLTFLNSR